MILGELGDIPPGSVLEPCAGRGAITDAVRSHWPDVPVAQFDINPDITQTTVRKLDYLDHEDVLTYDLCITNPPFSLAEEFVRKARTHCREVIMLLRLGFLESNKRAEFWRDNPADVYVLSRRPSFTGGPTDSCPYAWFAWGPGRTGQVKVLDCRDVMK